MRKTLGVWLLLSVISGLALADGPETGVVSGKITDVEGQPLPGVAVTIEGARGTEATVSDDSGHYRFALLVPGSYMVKGMLEGFKETERTVQVSAGSKNEVDLKLALGTAESITVT